MSCIPPSTSQLTSVSSPVKANLVSLTHRITLQWPWPLPAIYPALCCTKYWVCTDYRLPTTMTIIYHHSVLYCVVQHCTLYKVQGNIILSSCHNYILPDQGYSSSQPQHKTRPDHHDEIYLSSGFCQVLGHWKCGL